MIKTLEEYFNFSILIWWIKRALQVANSRRRQTLRFQSNERSVRPHRGTSAADQHGGDTRTVLAHSMYILVHRQQCIEVSITFVCLTSSQDGSSCMSARSRRALISRKSGLCLCVVEAGCYGSAGGRRRLCSLRCQICSRDSGSARLFHAWRRRHSRNASHIIRSLEDSTTISNKGGFPFRAFHLFSTGRLWS